jgi:hypothetical protein
MEFPMVHFVPTMKTWGWCHTMALPFTLIKKYLKAKEELMETQIFHHA